MFFYNEEGEQISQTEEPVGNLVTDSLYFNYNFADPTSYPGTGTTVFDLSSNNYNASANNSDGSPLPFDSVDGGGSFVFDANNDRISVGWRSNTFLTSGTNRDTITMDSFVKFTDVARINTLFQIGGYSNGAAIGTLSNGHLRFIVSKNTNPFFVDSPSPLQNNTWYHVVGSKTTTGISLYINGVLVSSQGGSYVWNTGTVSAPKIGYANTQTTLTNQQVASHLKGKVGNFRLYEDGLTDSEVLENFYAFKNNFGI